MTGVKSETPLFIGELHRSVGCERLEGVSHAACRISGKEQHAFHKQLCYTGDSQNH